MTEPTVIEIVFENREDAEEAFEHIEELLYAMGEVGTLCMHTGELLSSEEAEKEKLEQACASARHKILLQCIQVITDILHADMAVGLANLRERDI